MLIENSYIVTVKQLKRYYSSNNTFYNSKTFNTFALLFTFLISLTHDHTNITTCVHIIFSTFCLIEIVFQFNKFKKKDLKKKYKF